MKGIIADCLKEMIIEKAGLDVWKSVLDRSSVPNATSFSTTEDIDDELVLGIVQSACETLEISIQDAADMFGSYWMTTYAKRYYSPVYNMYKNSQEFLFAIDDIHSKAVRFLPGANPPMFSLSWIDESTILVDYKSERGLIDFAIGLAKGIGENYGDVTEVAKLSDTQFRVKYSK